MSRRDLIKQMIAGDPVDRCGFWLGNPDPKTWPILRQYFGPRSEEELRQKAGDDCRWICPQFFDDVYQDPDGRLLFDAGLDREAHAALPLASCETIEEVNTYPWSKLYCQSEPRSDLAQRPSS